MNTILSQLAGIARLEFTMHWRRRPLLVMTLTMLGMIALNLLVTRGDITTLAPMLQADRARMAAGDIVTLNTVNLVLMVWVAAGSVVAFIMPIAFADTIPMETQQGTRELLDTLPVPTWVYLCGKLLGVWAGMLSSIGIVGLTTALMWRALVGEYLLLAFADMWILGALGIGLVNSAFGVLLAATQPNRQRALLLTGALFVLPSLLVPASLYDGSLWAYLNPVRAGVLNFYLNVIGRSFSDPTRWTYGWESPDVLLSLGIGALQAAAALALVWGWRQYRARSA